MRMLWQREARVCERDTRLLSLAVVRVRLFFDGKNVSVRYFGSITRISRNKECRSGTGCSFNRLNSGINCLTIFQDRSILFEHLSITSVR